MPISKRDRPPSKLPAKTPRKFEFKKKGNKMTTAADKPKLGDPPPAPSEPVTVTVGEGPGQKTWAELHSQQASDIAAGKQPQAWTVATPATPVAEFPMVVYNQKTRLAKIAKDKDEKDRLEKDGYGEDPLPPEDPDALSGDDIKQLDAALHKLAELLPKISKAAGEGEKRPVAPPVKK